MEDTTPLILVVDDHPEVREVLAELLRVEGYRVATADGGLGALLQIGYKRPGCLVLDLKLEDISGFELYRVLRQDPEFCRLPVLFISGAYHDEDWLHRQLGPGPIHYLPKPIVPEDLTREMRALLASNP